MGHFTDEYMDRVNAMLHHVLNPTWFYKQEIDLVTALFVRVFLRSIEGELSRIRIDSRQA